MIGTQGRLTLAAACATLLSAATLAPLLQGGSWFAAVFLLVVLVGAVGAGMRSLVRWWPATVLCQLVTLALVITWLFARDTAGWGLLPNATAVRELADLYTQGITVTRDQTPPVTAIRGVLLLVSLGIGLVAVAVDLIAASLRRPAVAGLPLLAVYCVPAAVLTSGLSWWYFALAALGFLVLVSSDAVDRVRAWGRVLGPAGDAPGEATLGGPLTGARRLAVACVLFAAAVPAVVPGLGGKLFGGQGGGNGPGGGTISVINPILHLRDDLTSRSDEVVIRYTTTDPQPEPLRIVSDDLFDGDKWAPSRAQISTSNHVQEGLPAAPGLLSDVPYQPMRSTIDVLGLDENYLPLPYPTTKVQVNGLWIYDPRTLNVVGDGVTTQDLQYEVDHDAVEPTADELRSAGPPPTDVAAAYGGLPADLPPVIAATARRVGGTGTPYDQAVAIQDWLRSSGGFVYSVNVDPPKGQSDSGAQAVASFLANKRGYCVQFASAMAVMARTLGIPSRVAVGFLPGTQQPDRSWAITLRDAHAWPELYFSGVGWVRFEPTPASQAGTPPSWAQPQAAAAPTPTVTPTQSAAPSPTAAAKHRDVPQDQATTAPQQPLPDQVLAAVPWKWLGVLIGLALLAVLPFAADRAVRWSRWRRAGRGSAAARVEIAWDQLREQLDDLGVRWAASWTPRALQLRLVHDHGLPGSAQAALGRLVADVEHVRYAPPDDAGRDVAALRTDVAVVVRAVAASAQVPRWVRRRAGWLPTAGLRRAGAAMRRADAAADDAGHRVAELGSHLRRRVGRH